MDVLICGGGKMGYILRIAVFLYGLCLIGWGDFGIMISSIVWICREARNPFVVRVWGI